MITPISELKARARNVARAAAMGAALGVGGMLFALAGLACITAALWIVIATHQGAAVAFAVIGLIYLGVGAILLAFAAKSPRRHRGYPEDTVYRGPEMSRDPIVQVAEAFAIGLRAGRSARKR